MAHLNTLQENLAVTISHTPSRENMATGTATVIEHIDRYTAASTVGGGGSFWRPLLPERRPLHSFPAILAAAAAGRGTDVDTRSGRAHAVLHPSRHGPADDPAERSGDHLRGRTAAVRGLFGLLRRLCTARFSGSAFDAERMEAGTANVDFNPPMRAALAKLRDGERARLSGEQQRFRAHCYGGEAFERRVALAVRWLKGFVEVQAHQARMERRFSISGAMAQRFLRELPRQRTTGNLLCGAPPEQVCG